MSNDESQASDHALRERIASLMRSNQQARKKPISEEELQQLKAAASRLDQKLHDTADAARQSLKGAAARLDQLLADIQAGKDVTRILKRK